ncbi:MAG TPA: AmpG family muropeptide MFS transporter [Dongiaceae bacterium]|jgi:PAT family beta-lactamase induction signal transducer AmpG|nr:AmpG family muropeptide MFS transporter [Dongiaceae bacterium]
MKTERDWRSSLAIYGRPRLFIILLLGFMSGLPLLITGSTLTYWLSKEGIDRTVIGLFAIVGLPYSYKFLWSPFLDQVPLPLLGAWLGQRRSWLLVLQSLLAIATYALGRSHPEAQLVVAGWLAVSVAFLSASQDIVIDAYRIELLEDEEQGAGASNTQTGYRIGVLVAGAGAQTLSDHWHFGFIYAALAGIMACCALAVLFLPRAATRAGRKGTGDWFRHAVVAPFLDFTRHPAWLGILIFAILYKLGDAVAGGMASPFYHEMGFTGTQIGAITKIYGLLATIAGTMIGGALVARLGFFPALLWGGIAQSITNAFFAIVALHPQDTSWLALAITMENAGAGMGSAALVAYLSSLCSREFTATQYALLSSCAVLGRTFFAGGSGWLASQLGWINFFLAAIVLAVPGMVMLFYLWWRQARPGTVSEGVP